MKSSSQTSWFAGRSTVAVGLTVIVNVVGGPVHETFPLVNVGITVMVLEIAAFVLFVGVKTIGLVLPLVRLIAVLLLLQA